MEIDLDDYRDPEFVADRLRVSAETVRRWARRGRIPAIRVGMRWWIHRDVLKNPPK